MSDAEKLDRLRRLKESNDGVFRAYRLITDDMWSLVAANKGMLPEHMEAKLKGIEADSGIPYEHLCRLASVVREIYRARVEAKP